MVSNSNYLPGEDKLFSYLALKLGTLPYKQQENVKDPPATIMIHDACKSFHSVYQVASATLTHAGAEHSHIKGIKID